MMPIRESFQIFQVIFTLRVRYQGFTSDRIAVTLNRDTAKPNLW